MNAAATSMPPLPQRLLRRALQWGPLLALLAVAQTLLVLLTVRYEASLAQDATEAVAREASARVRRDLLRLTQALQALTLTHPGQLAWHDAAADLLRQRAELRRIERRDGPAAPAGGGSEIIDLSVRAGAAQWS